MRKLKEVFRLNHAGLSNRAIGKACSIGRETVREYLLRVAEAGLSWPLPKELSDDALESMLFPSVVKVGKKRSCPNWILINKVNFEELNARKMLHPDQNHNKLFEELHKFRQLQFNMNIL